MNLKQEAPEPKTLLRRKRSRYNPVDNEMREKLINMVNIEKYRLKKASEILQLNYNTAKTILRVWKKESRIKKKKKKKNYFKTKLKNIKSYKNPRCGAKNNFNDESRANEEECAFNQKLMMVKPIVSNNKNTVIRKNKQNSEICFDAAYDYKEKFNSPLKKKIRKLKVKRISNTGPSKIQNQKSCNNYNSINLINQAYIKNGLCFESRHYKNNKNYLKNNEYPERLFAYNGLLGCRLIRSSFSDLRTNSFSITFWDLNNKKENLNNYGKQMKFESKETKDFSCSPQNDELKTNINEQSFYSVFKAPNLFFEEFSRNNEVIKTDSFSIMNPNNKFKCLFENENFNNNNNTNNNQKNELYKSHNWQNCFSFDIKEFFNKYIDKNSITIEDINNELHLNSESKCVLGNLLSKIIQLQDNFSQFNKNIIRINQYLGTLFVMSFP